MQWASYYLFLDSQNLNIIFRSSQRNIACLNLSLDISENNCFPAKELICYCHHISTGRYLVFWVAERWDAIKGWEGYDSFRRYGLWLVLHANTLLLCILCHSTCSITLYIHASDSSLYENHNQYHLCINKITEELNILI